MAHGPQIDACLRSLSITISINNIFCYALKIVCVSSNRGYQTKNTFQKVFLYFWKTSKVAVQHPQHLLHHFLHFLIIIHARIQLNQVLRWNLQALHQLRQLIRSSLPHRQHCCFQTRARGRHALPRTISSSHQSNDDFRVICREVSITSFLVEILKRRTSLIILVQRVTTGIQQSVDDINR